MIIILREPLNSYDTLVSHSFVHFKNINMFVRCSILREVNYDKNKTMHCIYFFVDYVKSLMNTLMNTLVNGKENV